ncbi:hypothetical protein ACGFIU_09320 [Rhodococcus oryzae]|uniref:hypothetical protein n=1 Tax=Rhodococcus oryzae TaxID=2571143 RepID=UPI003720E0E9
MQLVIDTETGTVLSQNSTDGTDTASFLDLEVPRDVFDPDPFTWTGPVRSPRDLGKEHLARENEKQRRGQAWFRREVTDLPVTASVPVTFTPTEIRTFDEETGAFEAMFAKGLGTLWRRPRSEQTWYLPLRGARNFPIAWSAWSTTAFDWACGLDLPEGSLTTGTVTALQQQLHPRDQVTGEPPIG